MSPEPLSALSLASAVVQFIDFTSKLFSLTREVYHSASGASKETDELGVITKHLLGLCAGLSQPSSALSSGYPQDGALRDLADNCSAAGDELLKALQSLRGDGTNKRWKSFRLALATTWKQKKIDAMCKRLESYKSQLALHLIAQKDAIQSNEYSSILASLSSFQAESRQLDADMEANIALMKDEIMGTLALLGDELKRQLKENRAGSRAEIDGAQADRTHSKSIQTPVGVFVLSTSLSKLAKRGNDMKTSFRFLKSLRFRTMELRQAAIPEAHGKTYQWIFSEKYHFNEWLQSTEQIFWISGKPGSGKSTLMKFIVDHPSLQAKLKAWSGEATLVTASFFFWIAGTDLQKSQEGLLQSLLFQILKKHPRFIPSACPTRWRDLETVQSELDSVPWTRRELLESFKQLKQFDFSLTRFFFIIDGLDEYEGDHTDLLDVLNDLTDSLNVKICLSSRPWNIFESAFGKQYTQKLYMEEFNKVDIRLYVQDKLEKRPEFQRLVRDDSWANEMVGEIVKKSKGVFLWVYLVVRSLVDGLINHDRVMDLQKRLDDFPSDLDPFFRQIFTSLDPVYRTQTARTFQVALAHPRPLSLLNYWFLDLEEENPQFALEMKVARLKESDIRERESAMRKRLNARCKGLVHFETRNKLIIFGPNDNPDELGQAEIEVDFLHRTVKDFLMTEGLQKMIMTWLDSTFNPDLTTCRTLLAEFKSLPSYLFAVNQLNEPDEDVVAMVQDFVYHVRKIELRENSCPVDLVDELERVVSMLNMTENTSSALDTAMLWTRFWRYPSMLEYAACNSLVLYVQAKLEGNQVQWRRQQILYWASCLPFSRSLPSDTAVIRLALERGARPNERVSKRSTHTVWAFFLRDALHDSRARRLQSWPEQQLYDCLKLFLDYGAERFKKIKIPSKDFNPFGYGTRGSDQELYVVQVIEAILPEGLRKELLSLYPTSRPRSIFKWLGRG